MKKLVYFYLLVSLPCLMCVLWDTQRTIFAMEEGKSEEPQKTELSPQEEREKRLQEKLLVEERFLEQEQQAMQTEQKLQAQEEQQEQHPSKSSDIASIITAEKAEKKEIERTEQAVETLNKELAAELETTEPPSKNQPSTEELSPMTICIGSLISQNIAKSQNLFENKNNKDSFTKLTNELDITMEQLIKYEADKIGTRYYTMSINDIQTRRDNALKLDPKNKDYDKIYTELINQEQLIRERVKQLMQETTNAEIDLINNILEGCANKRFINILIAGEETSENILGED